MNYLVDTNVLCEPTKPVPDAKSRFGYYYDDIVYLDGHQKIAPLTKPKAKVRVADMLP